MLVSKKTILLSLLSMSIYCQAEIRVRPAAEMKGEINDWIKKVADWQLTQSTWNSDNNWLHGALFAGMMAAYEATKDETYLDKTRQWATQYNWRLAASSTRHADHHACAQAYLELYFLDAADPVRYAHAKLNNDAIVADPRHFGCDIAGGSEVWWWCDALFMHPPVLARLTRALNDPAYTDLMHMMWQETQACLFDTEENLFYRDINYFDDRVGGQKVFWARGNGWVAGGLPRVLQYLPADDPNRGRYVTLLQKMASRLIQIQQPDGYWYANLLYPQQFNVPETSGTGFFCYMLAWGINNGILDEATYGPAVDRAWAALQAAVHDDGKLGWVQPVGAGPAASTYESTQVYGVGAYLLAGSEVQKRELARSAVQIDSFEGYASNAALQTVWQVSTGNAAIALGDYGDRFMALEYQCDQPGSQAWVEMEFAAPRDLTVESSACVSLLMQGRTGNGAGQMFIQLEDADHQAALQVTETAGVLQTGIWREVAAGLAGFTGIDLTRIVRLRIGVAGTVPGSQGILRLDTLRLYPSRCYERLRGDFNDDCQVNLDDLSVMAVQWQEQYADAVIPVAPDSGHLRAHYAFDESAGTVATDSSGHGFDGSLAGAAGWRPLDGRFDGAIRIDGAANSQSRVAIPAASLSLTGCTVSMWVRPDENQATPDTRYLFGHSTLPVWSSRIQLYMDASSTALDLGLGGSHATRTNFDSLSKSQWSHVALSWDGSRYAVYVNGQLRAEGTYSGLTALQAEAHIGNNGSTGGSLNQAFNGLIDDVRIYDTVLTWPEVLYLAGATPILGDIRPADLVPDGRIDLLDLQQLLQPWIEPAWWP